jgi:RNA polymerase sigma-70 factor (ECF subfamily)
MPETTVHRDGDSSPHASQAKFEQLYRDAQPKIQSLIYSLIHSKSDTEDLLQRCGLILWKKFETYEPSVGSNSHLNPDASFMAWAYGIVVYETKNYYRTSSRDKHRFQSELMDQLAQRHMEMTAFTEESVEALQKCLEQLPDKDRKLLQQIYWDEVPIQDMAQELGIMTQSLYNRLSRMRQRLAQCVEKRCVEQRFQERSSDG